jgi:hypothetical protein
MLMHLRPLQHTSRASAALWRMPNRGGLRPSLPAGAMERKVGHKAVCKAAAAEAFAAALRRATAGEPLSMFDAG